MRETLFRGKRIDDGVWAEGNLECFHLTDGTPICYVSVFGGKMNQVAPETVGQYTGLKDKNGKRIFEGDIMRNAGNVVEFCNGGFCVNGDSPLALWTKTEVIGNIHDNPELLKEVKQP